jgi:light-regulated signal transduction histidine kinase (bacteriophytochrome)
MKNLILFAKFLQDNCTSALTENLIKLLQAIVDGFPVQDISGETRDLSTEIKSKSAEKMALISFIPEYTSDCAAACMLVSEIEEYYTGRLIEALENQAPQAAEKGFTKEQLLVKLENKTKELNEFSYIISHDLKAPLRAISSLTLWLQSDYGDKFDEEGTQFLTLLIDRVAKMDRLIDCILKYSRVVNNKEAKMEINLEELVQSLIISLAPPANISILIDTPLPTLVTGEKSIKEVFTQIIKNAIQFMDKPEGEIHIGHEDVGEHWKFYVKDNGPGIEKRFHEKIFEIFQTLQAKESDEISGMGLTIVKKIVEAHEGSVWVESSTGAGSTFYFTWNK